MKIWSERAILLYRALVRGLYIELRGLYMDLRGLYIIYSPRRVIYSTCRSIYSPRRSIYSPRTRAIYSNIALSGRNFDFLGLYYRGILYEKVKILQGM